MIKSYRCKKTESLFDNEYVAKFAQILDVGRRKLLILHAAISIRDLKVPPGNRLEALKGSRKVQYSIRVNDQWRVCFVWRGSDAYDVEIVDYH